MTNAQVVLGGLETAVNVFSDVATLAAWQGSFTPSQDGASLTENPPFVSATDLHLQSSASTALRSGGTPIAGVLDDVDGDARDWAAPDIGCDEVALTAAATPAGSNVGVDLGRVGVTYENVSGGGETQLLEQSGGPAAPGGLSIGSPPRYYELSTTASYDGAITVCVEYNPAEVEDQGTLKLMHYDTEQQMPGWVDITTSHDLENHVVCGTTTHFSAFALMTGTLTGVEWPERSSGFALHPCTPNPVVAQASLHYELPMAAPVQIVVTDVQGRRVRQLDRRDDVAAGVHTVVWDTRDEGGGRVRPGLYFVMFRSGTFVQSRRVVVTQ
jgi:hypothetical protein